ncbi:uncharacterized protein [Montipora capricornis]|uniref:uncharacterized protein n=1 Tax=Montipora capricornis TaxID=246305 RepID=UPI0035F1CC99
MVKDNDQLTVKHLRELWEKEFLPAIKSEIEAVKVQFQSQIAIVNERLQNIEQNQSSLSSKYDNLLVATQGANQKIQELEKSRNDLLNTVSNLEDSMYGNEVAIDDVQQYLRRDCLEIVGIPRAPHDNPKQLVQEVGSLIDVDIGVNDISTAHRLPDTKKVKNRITSIVKFVRRDKREEMYRNRRKLIGKNTSALPSFREEIGKSIPSGIFADTIAPCLLVWTGVYCQALVRAWCRC